MTFKEALQKDVAFTFLNVNEFAAEEELGFLQEDGTWVTLVLPILTHDAELAYAQKFAPELGEKQETLFVSSESLAQANIVIGTAILWRGKEWSVSTSRDEHGVTRLELLYR